MEVGFGRLNAGCSRVLYMLYLHTPRDRDQSGWRRRAAVKTLATEDGTFDIGRARRASHVTPRGGAWREAVVALSESREPLINYRPGDGFHYPRGT